MKQDAASLRAEMEALATSIRHHDRCYYQSDAPEITDAEYDGLRQKLLALEAAHPSLKNPAARAIRLERRLGSLRKAAPQRADALASQCLQ